MVGLATGRTRQEASAAGQAMSQGPEVDQALEEQGLGEVGSSGQHQLCHDPRTGG